MSEPASASAPPKGRRPGAKPLAVAGSPSAATSGPLPTAADMRRRRARGMARKLAVWVGIPTLLGALYYSFIASDQYESVASFTVESADGASAGGVASLLGNLTGTGTGKDTLVVRDYILSRDMLRLLAEQESLVNHFKDPSVDWVSRLAAQPTQEEAYEYYLEHIEVFFDTDSNVLTLRVRAFDADTSQQVASTILTASERMVNRMSDAAQRDSMRFAELEVKRAQERVSKARSKLMEVQGEGDQFNPLAAASGVQQIVTQLEGELAKTRAEMRAAASAMGPQSPRVLELREHVASLRHEITQQRKRLVGVDDGEGESVSESIARFEPAIFEKEFAERALQSALSAMEMARINASRQHRYLAVVAEPSKPDAPTHPNRPLSILTVFLLSVATTALGGLVVAAVREHAKV